MIYCGVDWGVLVIFLAVFGPGIWFLRREDRLFKAYVAAHIAASVAQIGPWGYRRQQAPNAARRLFERVCRPYHDPKWLRRWLADEAERARQQAEYDAWLRELAAEEAQSKARRSRQRPQRRP